LHHGLADVAKLPIPTTLKRRSPVVTAVAVLVVAFLGPTAANAGDTAGWNSAAAGTEHVTVLPRLEARLLTQINDLRRGAGLAPLRLSPALAAAAHEQSLSMAEHGFFGHDSFSGAPFWKRVETRYPKPPDGAWRVGENLVWSSPQLSARRALELWLNSPPHKQNLLTAAWREVGIAAVHASSAPGVFSGQDVTILTADFGVRH
jgi:uncharacterized protein YkwD